METAVNANTARTARERRVPARQARRMSNPTSSDEIATAATRSIACAWLTPRGPLTLRRNASTASTGPLHVDEDRAVGTVRDRADHAVPMGCLRDPRATVHALDAAAGDAVPVDEGGHRRRMPEPQKCVSPASDEDSSLSGSRWMPARGSRRVSEDVVQWVCVGRGRFGHRRDGWTFGQPGDRNLGWGQDSGWAHNACCWQGRHRSARRVSSPSGDHDQRGDDN
jgi:hypothetical protein